MFLWPHFQAYSTSLNRNNIRDQGVNLKTMRIGGERPINLKVVVYVVANLAVIATCKVIKKGCPQKCGNVSVPYPFGLRDGCALDEDFRLICNRTYHPPLLFLSRFNEYPITNISLDGYLRTYTSVASDCYTKSGANIQLDQPVSFASTYPKSFFFSPTLNKLMAVGCDTIATLTGSNVADLTTNSYTGCISACDKESRVINGSCSGVGCCQNMIPEQLSIFTVTLGSSQNHTKVSSFNPCSYVFSKTYLHSVPPTVPTIIDWAIGNKSCKEATKNKSSYACQDHSECRDYDSGPGYRCYCLPGYSGNPYVSHGCVDVNECEVGVPNNCTHKCHNTEGSYTCSCPKLYRGDGRRDGQGCSLDLCKVILIIIGATVFLILLLAMILVYLDYRRRSKEKKLRENFFKENGALILLDRISKREGGGSLNTIKVFKWEELSKATDNFNYNRICGSGGFGTVYKGELSDGSIVAIKKSNIVDRSQIEQFINEITVLSQINHRNVVRFLGCCLDTQVPLLVYEFITNGTLSDHIHNDNKKSRMSWQTRLNIAAETAGVLSYLHSAHSTPIIHRDIKPTNILLDDNYTSKVSDFGTSKLIPKDENETCTMVQGTLGYLDPEYLLTSQLNEKSDVYSFGVVLVELLIGLPVVSLDRAEEHRSLPFYFVSLMKRNGLMEILDKGITNEDNMKDIMEVAKIATMCVRVEGDDRPTMKEVAIGLEGLLMELKHKWAESDPNIQDAEYFLTKGFGNTTQMATD